MVTFHSAKESLLRRIEDNKTILIGLGDYKFIKNSVERAMSSDDIRNLWNSHISFRNFILVVK